MCSAFKSQLLLIIAVLIHHMHAYPMLRHPRHNHHHQQQHHNARHPQREEQRVARAMPLPLINYVEPVADPADEALSQRLRINTGHWSWTEAHSVREEVYVFAFTYFGMVTILMICLLVLVSCCYMYDCLGCYDPFWQKSSKGNNVFPLGDGQMVVVGAGHSSGEKSWIRSGKVQQAKRRWSIL